MFVVDLLEVIEVDEQRRERGDRARRLGHHPLHRVLHGALVREALERVRGRA
jgi:hypothetical protein